MNTPLETQAVRIGLLTTAAELMPTHLTEPVPGRE
jgi:hypothetical protein